MSKKRRTSTLILSLSPFQQLGKIDIVTRTHMEWMQESCFPSEPVFVASPGAVEEDDGEGFALSNKPTLSLIFASHI